MHKLIDAKTVVITGAGSGIGAALAIECARGGASSMLLVGRTAAKLEATAHIAKSWCPHVETFAGDITSPSTIQALTGRIHEKYGAPDVLINNAGIGMNADFVDTTSADWRHVFETNFFSCVEITRSLIDEMTRRGAGCIINVSSGAGLVPVEGATAYAASKAALVSFSESLRLELAQFNIMVTVACPGFVKSNMPNVALARGRFAAPAFREAMRAFFDARATPAEEAAKQILAAALANKGLAPVAGATPIWLLQRFLPAVVPWLFRKMTSLMVKKATVSGNASPAL